ncbi:hypothetical protein ACFOQM_23375 [Paenibacillus sp. GCM10012307]|uniref:Uncharacterized protein n=1 Tax=Paenibacillus roseus TaxID=2798579 RepID=A0A934MRE3_9BACL|nr:hypothetical protein [Paenibacillus roseus]MBJ6364166.1 hypothetical protein [Paenibacillus roseus]
MDEKKLLFIIGELYNAIADLTEGSNFSAQSRLEAVGPDLQKLISDSHPSPTETP